MPVPMTATRRWAAAVAAVILGVLAAAAAAPAEADEHEPEVRLREGDDVFTVATRAMTAAYPDGAQQVVLVGSESFADGLAAAGLSGIRGPLLPTHPDFLHPTAHALDELKPERAVLLGGEAAISADVERELRERDDIEEVDRIAGANRIDTAARVAEAMAPSEQIGIDPDRGRTAFLTNAWTQVDAVAAAPRAHQSGHPTVLTHRDEVPRRTREALDAFGAHTVVAVGGEAVVGPDVVAQLEADGYEVERVAGSDRFATAAAFAEWVGGGSFGYDHGDATLAAGGDDQLGKALVAGVYASAFGDGPPAPLLLVTGEVLPEPTERFLADHAAEVQRLHVVRRVLHGGTSVSDDVIDAAREVAAE